MRCEKVSENLSAYMAGELDEPYRHRLKQHLDGCRVCTSKVSELALLDKLFDVWEDVEPSHRFSAAFWAKIRSEENRRLRSPASILSKWCQAFAWPRVVLLASLCLMIVTGLYYHFTPFQNGSLVQPTEAEVQIAENLSVLKEYEILDNLDLLENFDQIQNVALGSEGSDLQHN